MNVASLFAVIVGGGVGSGLRFLISTWVQRPFNHFPMGILCVNVLGSFFIGLLAVLLLHKFSVSPLLRAGILVGVLGGFTTFSSFSLNTVELFFANMNVLACLNIFLSLILCLLASILGLTLGKWMV